MHLALPTQHVATGRAALACMPAQPCCTTHPAANSQLTSPSPRTAPRLALQSRPASVGQTQSSIFRARGSRGHGMAQPFPGFQQRNALRQSPSSAWPSACRPAAPAHATCGPSSAAAPAPRSTLPGSAHSSGPAAAAMGAAGLSGAWFVLRQHRQSEHAWHPNSPIRLLNAVPCTSVRGSKHPFAQHSSHTDLLVGKHQDGAVPHQRVVYYLLRANQEAAWMQC